ncbi:MAG: SusC/RagA family TonB-linked outer membrane protein [Mangrovibacterium sp.]
MKQLHFHLFFLLVCLGLALPASAQQGNRVVQGKVVDKSNAPIPGVTISVVGQAIGTISDINGDYGLQVPMTVDSLRFSFVGFESLVQAIPSSNKLNVKLIEEATQLDDVVVVGYGTQRKSDLTGAVTSVGTDDFNEGLISSPEQLISGKVSGVQISSASGSPTSGSSIKVRGGASLNASNDPLIVLDGLPLENGGISGNSGNFLSLINPNDIESMVILKDAASTAIYGSRGSNGVILITTKKGSGKSGMQVSFSSTNSIQSVIDTPDMLSREQFMQVVNDKGTAAQQALLGTANTDWNDQIYQLAYGTDNNLSLSTKLGANTPLRASLGYYNQDGILMTDNAERITGSLSVSPSVLDDHLKMKFSAKGAINNNRFANGDAIWAATASNPTLPVYSGNDAFGGYTEATNDGGVVTGATANPLGLLEQNKSTSTVNRLIGNADFDYQFHFLPELHWHTTLGVDYASGEGSVYVPAEAYQYYTSGGRDYSYLPEKNLNKLLTTYLNYNKYFENIKSNVEVTAGYDYQYWKSTRDAYSEYNALGEQQRSYGDKDQRHVLLSYYARLNYTFDSKYILTTSFRADGTSRFSEDNRWGSFPSIALAWRIDREEFMSNQNLFSTLKLRASYGITGQQDGIGNYNYLPIYTISQSGAQAQFGNQWINTYRPEAYVEDLTWETTKSWNFGFDFGFCDDRISGGLDYYIRNTEDLLATVPSAAGTNFDKNILTNVGNVDSRGVELTLNATPIQNNDWTWDVSFNASWQQMEVTNLSLIEGGEVTNTPMGSTIDGYSFQTLTEGYAPNMYYVYKQVYDEQTGRPIEGKYADLHADGVIDTKDLYRYHSPNPDFILGFSTSVAYKDWTLSTTLRGNIGNYVYNGMSMNMGALGTMSYNSAQLNNLSASYLETGFASRQYLSDYYVENASFLKMDNLVLGYNFGRVANLFNLNLTAMVQNVFTLTKYSGVDPEVPGGIDVSFYPRPRVYSLGLGINF